MCPHSTIADRDVLVAGSIWCPIMVIRPNDDPVDVTLRSYQAAAQRYADRGTAPGPALAAFLDRVVDLVGAGRLLEVGSGPGLDARYLRGRGLDVWPTDATPAFVEMMLSTGLEATLLDLRSDDLGGPWQGVLAQAVLLHLNRTQLTHTLHRLRDAVVDGGVLAFTVKEGDGDGWSKVKLDLPRHFTYWRERPLRDVLAQSRWDVTSVDHVAGRTEPWLYVLACAA